MPFKSLEARRAYDRQLSRVAAARIRRDAWRQTPSGKYGSQKHAAKQRGIAWELTFAEWWAIWQAAWPFRGRGKHELVMARYNDAGPYAVGNVRITTKLYNDLEREEVKRRVKLSSLAAV